MSRGKWSLASVLLLGLMLGVVAVLSAAKGSASRASPDAIPSVVAYQGQVQVERESLTGDGYFKFAFVNAAGNSTFWSNDGSSTGAGEPTTAVKLAVADGLFGVLLGDTSLSGMSQPLTADVFDQPDRYLRVWFSTASGGPYDHLAPDRRTASVPYALHAQEAVDAGTLDGKQASRLRAEFQSVVVVAKSGGDHTSVQAAMDSIDDASAANPYLVWVAPGVYSETVNMKPHVHLQGAGQEATVITSTATSAWPPTEPTLELASDSSLRDLTVGNSGQLDVSMALLATAGTTRTLVADITLRAVGSGLWNYGARLEGSGTGVTLQRVTALATHGLDWNNGLSILSGAMAMLGGGSFAGLGGNSSAAIASFGSGTTLEAVGVTALAENGAMSTGLFIRSGATAILQGGSFTGRGGAYAWGIRSQHGGTTLEAMSATVLAEGARDENSGLYNESGAQAMVQGGSFTGRGGDIARGIHNYPSDTMLQAAGVTALGESGSVENYGLDNAGGAEAILHGGSFIGRGGPDTRGIANGGSDATLQAEYVTALGESGSNANIGLLNDGGGQAVLHGGSFTGRGGGYSNGINHVDADTTLEANGITALGENGNSVNNGLRNLSSGAVTLRGGSYTGRGGANARGIYNAGSSTNVVVTDVAGRGEGGNSTNYGLVSSSSSATIGMSQSVLEGATNSVYRTDGSVTVANSRLVGGPVSSPSVICVLVSRGTVVSIPGVFCP